MRSVPLRRLPEHDEIVPANDDARLVIVARPHRVHAELARRGFGDIERRLTKRDLPRRHQEMHILPRRDAKLVDEIDLGPADDLAMITVDDGAEQLAAAIVEQ